ncbi:NAD(P)-dependent oxidoreductase, partial [Marivivens sp.]|uniref:NAD(P)-dependent oxidoreductase n=1 Tax=Marivivens sp. TaxID=1978374 RepID=UPI0025C1BC18
MQHFPIFLSVTHRRIVLTGGGEAALAKLRLLLKTEAKITVFAEAPHPDLLRMAAEG